MPESSLAGDEEAALRQRLSEAECALVEFSHSQGVTEAGLGYLRRAREALAAKPPYLVAAHDALLAFDCRLQRARQSQAAELKLVPWIWCYQCAWVAVLLVLALEWRIAARRRSYSGWTGRRDHAGVLRPASAPGGDCASPRSGEGLRSELAALVLGPAGHGRGAGAGRVSVRAVGGGGAGRILLTVPPVPRKHE